MKYLVILNLQISLLFFIFSCGNDTVINNTNSSADFDLYFYKTNGGEYKFSTYTLKSDGTGLSLLNDSLIISTHAKQNKIMLSKIDSNGMSISAIYYSESNGKNIVKIPTGNFWINYFDLSPDGNKFFFTSVFDQTLNLMNMDGSGYNVISDRIMNQYNAPQFSPNGEYIAYVETPVNNVIGIYISSTTGTYKKLIKDSITISSGFRLGWSPDSKKIIFQNRTGNPPSEKICIIDTSGNQYREITEGRSPAWSPDGNKICYIFDNNAGINDMNLINADGTDQINLTNTGNIHESLQSWSKDGSMIMYFNEGSVYPPYFSIYNLSANTTYIIPDTLRGAIWK